MKIFDKNDFINNQMISASMKDIQGDMGAHGHNFYEIEFIVDGSGIYEIDGVEYEIKKNTLFLMTPASVHAIRNSNATLINVMFSYEYGKESLDFQVLLTGSPCFYFDSVDGAFLYSLLFELSRISEDQPSYALLLTNCVLNKLRLNSTTPASASSSYIQRAILYMLENFRTGVTLAATAKHLGLSSAYFSDFFRSRMNLNFKDYLDDIRFSYAKKLLSLTDMSIKEVQFQSGFYDYANFARRFKQKYGITPSEYRKKNFTAK